MNEIQSKKNALIKETKKLSQKKYRQQSGQYLIDGWHLVQEAIRANAAIQAIFVTSRGYEESKDSLQTVDAVLYLITEEIADYLSELPTPQGIFAIVAKENQLPGQLKGNWLILDNVQDPGNVGTMIRTADAAGFTGVFLGTGTADLYSSKVLRSMQGSNFHLPIVEGAIPEFIEVLRVQDVKIYGTELNKDALAYTNINTYPAAFILGNEGQGVQKDLLAVTDQNVYIPIYGEAESLNVAIAAGILMYHAAGLDH